MPAVSESISADFPYEPHFSDVLGSRMHYVDEGEGDPVVFLHGNPTSSYLWRNVIPHVSGRARCIAPDLIGFGKSDKPDIGYRFVDHARYLDTLFENLDLGDRITFVLHDWGSALGFHWAKRHPGRVKALCFMEAILEPFRWADFPPGYGLAFRLMRAPFTGTAMTMGANAFVKGILPSAIVRKLTSAEKRAYAEPFPTFASRKPVAVWPKEIPIDGHPADTHRIVTDNRAWLAETEIPKLLIYAHPGGIVTDEVRQRAERDFSNLSTVDIGEGVHYLQEDAPHEIGRAIARWYMYDAPDE